MPSARSTRGDGGASRPRVTVLSTADFDSELWTNKQYLAAGLAERTYVTYIESMGLRAPTLSRADLARVGTKIRRLVQRRPADAPGAAVDGTRERDGVDVVGPTVVPFHGIAPVRAVNRLLVERGLVPRLDIGPDDVLWTFSPLTYGLERRFPRVVYHSVDLLHELPGVPTRTLLAAERALLAHADHVVASSEGVRAHLRARRDDVLLWENVAEVGTFADEFADERPPTALFAGNLTPTKVDFGLLREVADRGVALRLAGPRGIDGVESRALNELCEHPGVDYIGRLSLRELARECGHSAVGLIPYVRNRYTRGVFPLKVYEYLAAGMDVVSTPIDSLVSAAPTGVRVVADTDFAGAVRDAAHGWTVDAAAERRADARTHSWTARIDQAWNLVGAEAPVR